LLIAPLNNGNYLGILELLGKYDAFLAADVRKYGKCGLGHAYYLLSTIFEEFIRLICDYVQG
jgi:hypothetical protein